MKQTNCYFQAIALKDGTALSASPTIKPGKNTRSKINPEGVWLWHAISSHDLDELDRPAKLAVHATIANSLNVRRAIRQLAGDRLDAIEVQLTELHVKIDRIERAMCPPSSPPVLTM